MSASLRVYLGWGALYRFAPKCSIQELCMRIPTPVRFASVALIIGQLTAAQLVLPNGTKLTCRLEQTISSATADEGQQVQLSVTEPVKVNGVVVIPQGAPVIGTIVLAEQKKSLGRAGKLDFSVDKVRAGDG